MTNTRHDVKNRGCKFSYVAASFGMIYPCTCPPSEDINKTSDFVSKTEEDVNKPTTSPDSQYREDKEAREEALRLEWKQYIDFAVGDDDSIEGLTYRGVADWWIRKLATIEATAYDRGFKEASVHCKLDHDTAYARGKEDGAREMRVEVRDKLENVLFNEKMGNTAYYEASIDLIEQVASLTPLLNDKE